MKQARGGWSVLLAAAVLLLSAGSAWGQAQNTGSIYGTVTDPSGAVVVGATVTVAEPDKGVNRTVTTSKTGEYSLSDLSVGTYFLTVTAPGFETNVASSITVDADKSVKIPVKLTIGSKNETVQVDASGTALDTRSATIGTLIPETMVEELPIDGTMRWVWRRCCRA